MQHLSVYEIKDAESCFISQRCCATIHAVDSKFFTRNHFIFFVKRRFRCSKLIKLIITLQNVTKRKRQKSNALNGMKKQSWPDKNETKKVRLEKTALLTRCLFFVKNVVEIWPLVSYCCSWVFVQPLLWWLKVKSFITSVNYISLNIFEKYDGNDKNICHFILENKII